MVNYRVETENTIASYRIILCHHLQAFTQAAHTSVHYQLCNILWKWCNTHATKQTLMYTIVLLYTGTETHTRHSYFLAVCVLVPVF
jgi:hypothetical protein